MLSRLLRRALLGLLLAGALLGWLIARQTDNSEWLAVVGALALPLLIVLLVVVSSGIRSRTPGDNARWGRSLLGEYVAMLRVFLLRQPWAVAKPVVQPATAAPARVPVVLVHGYLCNHRVWDAMVTQLRRAGHPVLSVDLEPLFASIEQYVPIVEQAVVELCRQTGAQKVALVGHSMGGLVIRAWMRVHGSDRVARVITLGTPHAGTRIAPRTRSANGIEMVWGNSWLQQLSVAENAATRSLMRIGLTPQDHIVYPQREQVIEGVPVTPFDGLGHLELCLNAAVIAWVLQQLDDLTGH